MRSTRKLHKLIEKLPLRAYTDTNFRTADTYGARTYDCTRVRVDNPGSAESVNLLLKRYPMTQHTGGRPYIEPRSTE